MFKKSRIPAFVPKALALAFTALISGAYAQAFVELDVILRDFEADYSGFEMFDSDLDLNGVCAGSNPSKPNTQVKGKPQNAICVSGNEYVSCTGSLSGSKNDGGSCNSETDRDCIWSYPNQLLYGEYEDCTVNVPGVGTAKKRGYKNGPDVEPGCAAKRTPWANPVFVTKGMVKDRLDYSQCPSDMKGETGTIDEALKGRYCARPMPDNGACYGNQLHNWFTDNSDAKTLNDVMQLNRVSDGVYQIKYDYNTYEDWGNGYDNGYFPLDRMDKTWGKQSLNAWCGAHYPDDGQNGKVNCNGNIGYNTWHSKTFAREFVQGGKAPSRKLHNYGFTMAGSAEFKYHADANDIFEFIGDDDMWIFIDGNLVVDLGGTHLAAPDRINIRTHGQQNNWEDGTMHVINFFYADRQTDGSNMMLKLAITELTPPQFGVPYIKKAETTIADGGKAETIIYVNSQLDLSVFEPFKNNHGYGFPIIVKSINDNTLYGYRIESISLDGRNAEGYIYTISGTVCKNPSCSEGSTMNLVSGDSLSFNIELKNFRDFLTSSGIRADEGFALNDISKSIRNMSKKEAVELKLGKDGTFGRNQTNRAPEDLKPAPTDQKPIKPPFAAGDPNNFGPGGNAGPPDASVPPGSGGAVNGGSGSYDGRGQLPNVTQVWDPVSKTMVRADQQEGARENNIVHGFGVVGAQIPPQRAGELILTAYPNANSGSAPAGYASYEDWKTAYKNGEGDAEFFGLPPEYAGKNSGDISHWWGLANPTTEALGGGYQFVKNGFPNESSTKGSIKITPTRCTAIIDKSKPKGERASINCLNFNMPAQQPFQLAVTVYDQLGNFVTQYRETVSEQEFRNATQGPNYVVGGAISTAEGCEAHSSDNYGKPTTTTTNGVLNVNVNIYPFSTTGRRFGNGVYIVKVDRVDIPFTGCQVLDGQAGSNTMPFIRSHSEQKFGWMRSK